MKRPLVLLVGMLAASSAVADESFVHPLSGIKYTQVSESVLYVTSGKYWSYVFTYAYDGQDLSDRQRLAEQAHDLLPYALPRAMRTKAEKIGIQAQVKESSWLGGLIETKRNFTTVFRKSSAGSWIANEESDPGSNTFVARYLGFSITKPPSWSFDASHPQSAANVLNVKKHPSPYHGLNTLVEVLVTSRKSVKTPIVEALGQHAERAARQLNGTVSAKAHPVELGGRQWYVAIVKGRIDADGELVEAEAQMWRTTHNGAYHAFNFNGPANETARAEFAEIRQSIRFLERTPPYAEAR
jgi:hypothetical protein